MSIRWALSLGIICLLALMALGQIWLLQRLENQLAQQVTEQSTEITRVVLSQTAANLELLAKAPLPPEPPVPATRPRLEIIEIEHQGKQLDVRLINDQMRQAELAREAAQRIRTQIQPEQLKQQLEQLQLRRQQARSTPLLAEFSRYAVLLIVSTTLLAILIALLLGHRLIKPLQHLVQGFRALQQGQLGQQVPVSGLSEYRYVSDQFNQMSVRLAELAEQSQRLQQQQHLAELGEISRGMVHALRNPLHTLNLLLEQVACSDDPALRQRLTEQAERKMQHINRSLTAMLTLSCADIERSKLVALKPVLQDLLLEFSSDQTQIRLAGDLAARLPGAETELRTILHSILANAVEASPPGGEITIEVREQPTALQIQIRDQGPGLDPAIASRLFQPHCSGKAEGAGMGLYLCSRLLKLYYQGEVQLHNHPQGGCVATLTFHRTQQHD